MIAAQEDDRPDVSRAAGDSEIEAPAVRDLSGGMNDPVASNEDPVLRLRNQRVEIVISDRLVEFNFQKPSTPH